MKVIPIHLLARRGGVVQMAALSAALMSACLARQCGTPASCASQSLARTDYSSFVIAPQHITKTQAAFVMNVAGAGHMELARRFTAAVGIEFLWGSRAAAARRLLAANRPFVYLTLTNDHLPTTERGHDATLRWERSAEAASGTNMRLIGPPGLYKDEASRKKAFCRWSEELSRSLHDQSLRFSLPCAMGEATLGEYVPDYKRLMEEEEKSSLVAPTGNNGASPPLWIVRTLRGKNRVIAFGVGMQMRILPSDRVAPDSLQPGKSLLLRFLHPPLLQRGLHLGTPVATRFEVRFYGLIQWQPLRLWISGHGFVRSGSPWWNYTTSSTLNESNRLMWELSAAPDPSCAPLPGHLPPWVSSARYQQCKGSIKDRGKDRQPPGCCLCQTVGDVLDIDHGERGFATTGTLRKLEHIARASGIAPSTLRRNADEVMTRYIMMQQREWIAEANGTATLSRWQTPFSMDVAFGADGRAWVYDSHLLPTWKRPGHWSHQHIDRGNALGTYSSLMLAMSHLLVSTEAVDNHHKKLLASTTDAGKRGKVLEFLRDQGFASVLGFRRAWPSPRHTQFSRFASEEDASFARLLDEEGLLIPSMDALSSDQARRRSDRLLNDRSSPWAFGGLLYSNQSKPAQCEDAERILASWGSARAAPAGAAGD